MATYTHTHTHEQSRTMGRKHNEIHSNEKGNRGRTHEEIKRFRAKTGKREGAKYLNGIRGKSPGMHVKERKKGLRGRTHQEIKRFRSKKRLERKGQNI